MHLACRCSRRIHTTSTVCTAQRVAQQQHLSRRGQNLTKRYQRLERSIREWDTIPDQPRAPTLRRVEPTSLSNLRNDPSRFFKGFHIPEEPKPPEPDGWLALTFSLARRYSHHFSIKECCMSGCAICVHDLYQDALTAYHDSLESLCLALSDLHIPESEWPTGVRRSEEAKTLDRNPANVSLIAFEELERKLRAKRGENIRR
jgi:hypothetical protein